MPSPELVSRLRKIEGQVRGIQRMLAEDAECVDVLTQISAVRSGVEKVGLKLLRDHLRECVSGAVRAKGSKRPKQGEEQIEEIVGLLDRYLSS
jgi:DNA-binding FrmR family transcriptional regulator